VKGKEMQETRHTSCRLLP